MVMVGPNSGAISGHFPTTLDFNPSFKRKWTSTRHLTINGPFCRLLPRISASFRIAGHNLNIPRLALRINLASSGSDDRDRTRGKTWHI